MTILISRFILNIHGVAISEDDAMELSTFTSTGYSDPAGAMFTTRVDINNYSPHIVQQRRHAIHAAATEDAYVTKLVYSA